MVYLRVSYICVYMYMYTHKKQTHRNTTEHTHTAQSPLKWFGNRENNNHRHRTKWIDLHNLLRSNAHRSRRSVCALRSDEFFLSVSWGGFTYSPTLSAHIVMFSRCCPSACAIFLCMLGVSYSDLGSIVLKGIFCVFFWVRGCV